MDRGQAAHDRVVANLDMSGECPVVRKNDCVPNHAIVSDMAVSEKVSAIADAGFARASRAAIYRDEFPKRILVADFQIRSARPDTSDPGFADQSNCRRKFIPGPGRHRAAQSHVILEPAIPAKDDSGPDDAIRSDDCAGSNFRLCIHDGGRVDLHILIDP
jgi:hypothetical protein